jgi:hypothetical protein
MGTPRLKGWLICGYDFWNLEEWWDASFAPINAIFLNQAFGKR